MAAQAEWLGWARAWLRARGSAWEEDGGDADTIFRIDDGVPGRWHDYLQVHVRTGQVTFISIFEEHVPPEARAPVAEYVLRASYGMNSGTFDMDVDDGEVRFRSGVGLGEAHLEEHQFGAVLDELARTNEAMTSGYLPGLVSVIGGQPPVTAVRAAEG